MLPFDDSRRQTGGNLYFADVGAVLETQGIAVDDALLAAWRDAVERARAALGWPSAPLLARRHAGGASLAMAAPIDQLLAATEVNEWALLSALGDAGRAVGLHAPAHPAAWDEASALMTLRAFAAEESHPALAALHAAARGHGVDALVDDDALTLGAGRHAATWPIDALPDVAQVDWTALRSVPIALVTGSNGKTTTTRLLAAILRARGAHVAHTCTDGVFVDGELLEGGDYSGPAGARTALRVPEIDFAVLETARGGLLRRGLAVQRADVAVVTNVSDDHFGEYGVHELAELADVKLTVARALGAQSTLVLNADDALLVRKSGALGVRIAWFSLDADSPLLIAHRAAGGVTCGLREGRLLLHVAGVEHDLGEVAAMPLTFGGTARYNIANLAAAALAAHALGVDASTMAAVAARFGASRTDNPGRLQHLQLGDVAVVVDYAHNPEGLQGLLDVIAHLRRARLGLLLGQAGNRGDAEIRELAAVAARARPERVVLKDIGGMLRGRESGEVAQLLSDELLRQGIDADAVSRQLDEYEAVIELLAWAKPGDVLVLPVHGVEVKARVTDLLQALEDGGWRAGQASMLARLAQDASV